MQLGITDKRNGETNNLTNGVLAPLQNFQITQLNPQLKSLKDVEKCMKLR